MIYIFKGCEAVCSVPAACCAGCGKACDNCSKELGECCSLPCIALGACCARLSLIHERPLGAFVFLAWFLNGISIVGSVMTFMSDTIDQCEHPMKYFVFGQLFNACIHSGFVLYMQERLVEGLQDDETGELLDVGAAEMLDELKQIAVYDIGFCLYFFLFIFSLGWNTTGVSWAYGNSTCDPGHWPTTCAVVGFIYNFLTIQVSCCHPVMLWLEEHGCCCLCVMCGCAPSGLDGGKKKTKHKSKFRALNDKRIADDDYDEEWQEEDVGYL